MDKKLLNFSRIVKRYFNWEDPSVSAQEVFFKNFRQHFGKIFKEKFDVELFYDQDEEKYRYEVDPENLPGVTRLGDRSYFRKDGKEIRIEYFDRDDTKKYAPEVIKELHADRAFEIIDSNTVFGKLQTEMIPISDDPYGFRDALVVVLTRGIEDLFQQCHQSFDFEKDGKNFFEEMFLQVFPKRINSDGLDILEVALTRVTPHDRGSDNFKNTTKKMNNKSKNTPNNLDDEEGDA